MKQFFTHALLRVSGCLALLAAATGAQAQALVTAAPTVKQLWIKNHPNGFSAAKAVQVATDKAGNVYETYYTTSFKLGASSTTTTKYGPDGTQLWVQDLSQGQYSGTTPVDMAVDGDGNVYVTGYSQSRTYFGNYHYDYITVKYSTAGYQRWVSRYDSSVPGAATDDFARALALDAEGNVYVTGSSATGGSNTVKYDTNGKQLWATHNKGTLNDVAADGAGGAYVTGTGPSKANFVTLRYNANGKRLWRATYNSPSKGIDVAKTLAVDATGNVVVTGSSAGDYATVKYSPAGKRQWAARYDGPAKGTDAPQAIAVDATGNVLVTGTSAGTGTGADYATLKYSPAGAQEWVARYNSPGNGTDQANAVAADAVGNVYVTGGAGGQYATLRYSTAGKQQWVVRYANTDNQYNQPGPASAKAIALDAQASVIVTGNANTLYNFDNVATIKYVQNGAVVPPTCDIFLNQPRVPGIKRSTSTNTALTVSQAELLSGSSDPLGRTLTAASFVKPSSGTIAQNSDGSYTYTPSAGFQGEVKLTYLVQETGPVLASSATRHYYEFVSAPGICWDAAKTAAAARTYRGMQGYLATITYQDEEDFLKGRNNGQYFIGASDAAEEGQWHWMTGPEAGTLIWSGKADGYGRAFTNWQPGQPDDYQNQYRPQGEDYSLFYGQSGYWNDVDNCNSTGSASGYLVEYGGLEPCRPILFSLATLTVEVGGSSPAARQAPASASLASAPTLEAWPNPINGQFRVQVAAVQDGPARLELFDLQGRLVRSLYGDTLTAGEMRELEVDGTTLADGLYQLRLQTGGSARYLRLSVLH